MILTRKWAECKFLWQALAQRHPANSDGVCYCKFSSTFVWVVEMFPTLNCNWLRFTTWRTSPAHVAAFPNLPSATGRVPSGRRGSSPRTLTTGLGTDGPELVTIYGEDAGRCLPLLAIPMADEGEFTLAILLTLSAWFMRFVPTFRPSRPIKNEDWVISTGSSWTEYADWVFVNRFARISVILNRYAD